MPLLRHRKMRLLLAAASISALCLPTATVAQTPMNPIDYCRENSDGKSERIACLEAAVTGLMSGMAPTAEAMAEATAEETPARKAEAEPAAESSEPETVAEAPTGLGAHQVEKRIRSAASAEERKQEDKERPRVEAAVLQFATTPLGKAVFILDNGQVWRQKRSDRNRVKLWDNRNYTVTVNEGMLSGYRLTVNELKKTILVERIK